MPPVPSAHRFGNPLGTVLIKSDAATRECPPPPLGRGMLETVNWYVRVDQAGCNGADQ
jgi:hypothetical protein